MFFCSTIAFVFVRILKVVKTVNMPRRDYMRKVMPIGETSLCQTRLDPTRATKTIGGGRFRRI